MSRGMRKLRLLSSVASENFNHCLCLVRRASSPLVSMAEKKTSGGGAEGGRGAHLPEGRRVVKKRRRRSSQSKRESIDLSQRQIASGISDSDNRSHDGPLDVRGQVDRLRQIQKDKKNSSDEPLEDKWGSKKHRRKGGNWVFLAILGIVIPLLGLVLAISFNRSSEEAVEQRQAGGVLNLDEEAPVDDGFDATDPIFWFQRNSVEAYDDAIDILEQINEAETADSTVELMRDEDRTRERLRVSGFEWDADFEIADPRKLGWVYNASGDTGFMAIMGRNSLFDSFRAYFVKTKRGLKLDWAATTAWCEVPVSRLVEESPEKPVTVRGWLTKKQHFDSDGQKLISWYQVVSADKEDAVWVYTVADSDMDEEIKDLMSFGTFVIKKSIEEIRATVRLRKGDRTKRPNEFELVEFVAKDWVQP